MSKKNKIHFRDLRHITDYSTKCGVHAVVTNMSFDPNDVTCLTCEKLLSRTPVNYDFKSENACQLRLQESG
jgi:hypothetical protein